MLNVLRMHRAEAAKIDEELVPPELLGAAQQSWDEAVELGERYGVRNSQATRARADRHDRPDDGLRHHRHRARPRAHQGEEARRWRHDVHRQPDDPACAAQARLLRRRRSTRSSPTSTSTRRSSARPRFKAEHLPVFACSMGDNTIHYMGHVKMMGAVQPFISRRDLEDREHARGRDGRRRRGAPHRVVAARPQGGRDLPRQLQGRAAARDAEEGRRRRRPTASSERRSSASSRPSSCRSRSARSCRARAASKTFSFRVADCHGYATVGEYEDGRPGELFLQGRQAGLDARRHHGRVRDLGEPRPAVRRAARGVRRDVHEHALRARGHDRRPRHPVRDQPRRLHLPPARGRVPADGEARGDSGILTVGERLAADAARRRGGGDRRRAGRSSCSRSRTGRRRRRCVDAGVDAAAAPRPTSPAREREAVLCHVCGDIMQRAGSLPRLPELRQHQRLLVMSSCIRDAAVLQASAEGLLSNRR